MVQKQCECVFLKQKRIEEHDKCLNEPEAPKLIDGGVYDNQGAYNLQKMSLATNNLQGTFCYILMTERNYFVPS